MLIERVRIRSYRSISACDVRLRPYCFLVGPNGSGKSNFLDALRLIADSLNTTLDHALRERGGIKEVRRRSSGHPNHFSIRIDFRLPPGVAASYAFEVGARAGGSFFVKRERCRVGRAFYDVRGGVVESHSEGVFPAASDDRLFLVAVSGLPEFRAAYDALASMGFYNLNPDQIRALQPPDKGDLLARDGRNLASVLSRFQAEADRNVQGRLMEYLRAIVPGTEKAEYLRVGHMESIQFRQRVQGATAAWKFPAINMSDGTLRALGILIALFQGYRNDNVRLVGIEEPETALHPAAAGALRDAIREASAKVQVVATSHSPDLLDDDDLDPDSIIVVEMQEGVTQIGALDSASREVVKERLYTVGELLRASTLTPDASSDIEPVQLKLWDDL